MKPFSTWWHLPLLEKSITEWNKPYPQLTRLCNPSGLHNYSLYGLNVYHDWTDLKREFSSLLLWTCPFQAWPTLAIFYILTLVQTVFTNVIAFLHGLTPLKAECSPAPDYDINHWWFHSCRTSLSCTAQPHKELVVQFCYLSVSWLNIFP